MGMKFKHILNKKFKYSIITIIVISAILLSQISGMAFGVIKNDAEIWDGSIATKFAGGSGTSADPYLISNGAELAWAIHKDNGYGSGKYYKITKDIYLNDPESVNWSDGTAVNGASIKEWTPRPFSGTLDGAGHVIYGLYNNLYATNNKYWSPSSVSAESIGQALITRVYNGGSITIKNLGMDCVYIHSPHSASAFVGSGGSLPVTITNSFVGANSTIKGYSAGAFVGWGNLTSTGTMKAENCYSLATVIGVTKNVVSQMGFFGAAWNKYITVNNSYSSGSIANPNYTTVTNCYSTTQSGNGVVQITKEQMQGTTAKEKMPNLDWKNTFVTTDLYPALRIFTDEQGESGEIVDEKYWDGTVASTLSGSGTPTEPYIIENGADLAFAVSSGGNGAYYKIVNDIYLNKIEDIDWTTGKINDKKYFHEWQTGAIKNKAAYFSGTIDGDGHVIYGLYSNYNEDFSNPSSYWINAPVWATGFIQAVAADKAVTVKNLGFDYIYLHACTDVGIIGNVAASAQVVFNNCYIGENGSLKGGSVGSFVGCSGDYKGKNHLVAENCYSLLTNFTSMSGNTANKFGFWGGSWNATGGSTSIINCYAIGMLPCAASDSCSGCYSATQSGKSGVTKITKEQMQGESAKVNMAALDWYTVYITTDKFPALRVFTGEFEPPVESKVWDGTVASSLDGAGTADDPYIISKGSELAFAVTSGGNGKHYKLTSDIYLNDTENIDWSTGKKKSDSAVIRTWNTQEFNGTIDGDGHVIYGLYNDYYTDHASGWNYWIAADGAHSAGFIKVAAGKSVTLKNLGFDCIYLHSPTLTGIVSSVASTGSVTFEKCYLGANGKFIGAGVGSFIGAASDYSKQSGLVAVNCYSLMTDIDAKKETAKTGFFGATWYNGGFGSINYCYSLGNIVYSSGDHAKCCYSAVQSGKAGVTKLEKEEMQGETAKINMPNLNWRTIYGTTDKYPILFVFTGDSPVPVDEGEVWSGLIADEFAGGTGTQNDPYIIADGSQLARAVVNAGFNGSYFKISKDIYLNDVNVDGWQNSDGVNSWYSDTSGFKGHLDGDGHIVYGIWYKDSVASTSGGLIPLFYEGSVKNIGVRKSYIYAGIRAGGIIGEAYGSGMKTVDCCFVDETVNVKFTKETTGGAGGIIGYTSNTKDETAYSLAISNCYSKAALDGYQNSYRANGIIGTSWMSGYTMENCYTIGYSAYRGDANGAISSLVCTQDGKQRLKPASEVYKNIYTDSDEPQKDEIFTFVSDPDSIRGDNAKSGMPGLNYKTVFETVKNGTPKLKIFKSISGEDINISPYTSGKGSKSDPYVITTAEQLRILVQSSNTKAKYYKLGNDIYINNTKDKNWLKNNPAQWYTKKGYNVRFMGTLEGDGHTIYGIYINEKPTPYEKVFLEGGAGLFPVAGAGAVIRNVHIRDSYISGSERAGAFIGSIPQFTDGYITIAGCSVDESVTVKGQTAGGIFGAGLRGLKLNYCYSLAKVEATGPKRTNALIGDIWTGDYEVCECYSVGYTGFRNSYPPDNFKSVYGTVATGKTVVLTKAKMTGAAAKKNMPGLSWGKIWYTAEGLTPQLKLVKESDAFNFVDEGVKNRVWSGLVASKFAGGSGTEKDPYLIETPEQMALLISKGNSANKYYKLVADLKINDVTKKNWKTSAKEWFAGFYEFGGNFDGNGHIVSGLYINTEGSYAALFPQINSKAVIKKLGIVNSYIGCGGDKKNMGYAAALVGYVNPNTKDANAKPKISECFADHTTSVNGFFAGGLVCGCAQPVELENCYYTGSLKFLDRRGGLLGNCWVKGSVMTNCYVNTANRDTVCGGAVTSRVRETVYNNVYADYETNYNHGVVKMSLAFMQGKNAEKYMTGFDFKRIWATVSGGTPVLRAFANNKKYSCTREPTKVKIEFGTNGGNEIEPIYGYPKFTKIPELPVPTRKGYKFEGWYCYSECDVPFEFKVFPNYDIYLFAKWTPLGFSNGFETNVDEDYDIGNSAMHFRPGTLNYNTSFVHNGLKSLKIDSDTNKNGLFLLSYENKLEVGQEYEITFFANAEENITDVEMNIIHALHPQVNSDSVGKEKISCISNLTKEKWQECKFTFTAQSKYLVFDVKAPANIYFDDFSVIPTGKSGELKDLETVTNGGEKSSKGTNIVIPIVVVGAVLLIAISVGVVLIVKKKKHI